MIRDISNMSMFQGLEPVEHNFVVDPEYVPTDSEFDRILKEIYSVDENTGLPKGDLLYYLSPDGNPQVKAWLENNLLKPRAAKAGTSVEGVTDDMLAEYSKGSDESPSAYVERMRGIYESTTKEILEYKSKVNANEKV